MIIRKIHTLNNQKKFSCKRFKSDPHSRFICVHNNDSNSIQIIKITQIQKSILKQIIKFGQTNQYSYHENIVMDYELVSALVYNKQEKDLLISISKMYKNRQFMAISDHFTIRIYEVVTKQSQISLKPLNQICLQINMPILNLNFIYSALYVSYYNRNFRILEYKENQNKWLEDTDLIRMNKQFIRIAVVHSELEVKQVMKMTRNKFQKETNNILYEKNQGQNYQNQQNENKNKNKEEEQQQEGSEDTKEEVKNQIKNQMQTFYLQNQHKINSSLKKSIQLQSINSLLNFSPLAYQYNTLQQPQYPIIIYQRTDNSLYQSILKKNSSEFDDFVICDEYQKPESFQNEQKEMEYFDLNEEFPTRYTLSQCQRYIVCVEKEGKFSVRSKMMKWDKIAHLDYSPEINPYFYKIEERVFYRFFCQFNEEEYSQTVKYFKENYEIFLTANIDLKNEKEIILTLHIVNLKVRKLQPSSLPRYKIQQYPVCRVQNLKSKILNMKWVKPQAIICHGLDTYLYFLSWMNDANYKMILHVYMILLKRGDVLKRWRKGENHEGRRKSDRISNHKKQEENKMQIQRVSKQKSKYKKKKN